MKLINISLKTIIFAIILISTLFLLWLNKPLMTNKNIQIEFEIQNGTSFIGAIKKINSSGLNVSPFLMKIVARFLLKDKVVQEGSYRINTKITPLSLIKILETGSKIKETITIIEGWTFKQMRNEINNHPKLKHDSNLLSDAELIKMVSNEFKNPEGLFYPDTYVFDRGASDFQIYKKAHQQLIKILNQAWKNKQKNLPYKNIYEALILASIIEKESSKVLERPLIASVFINRLKKRMRLQTDPTVIYGMGDNFKGNLRKKDLKNKNPYNTYVNFGLPPTPISLTSHSSIKAALNPKDGKNLYFVAKGDGSSHFSENLIEHNKAVNKYQRKLKKIKKK
tara:strand:+ start:468 stop:1481 length:1014 start_codon:yes stop_codon:yes gene_type:complete